ncbi:MAG: LysR family transcriptional regulator [Rhizobiaceae bacterium]|nr:MAG: LysR family transcriptional regulator [Rhizobiaceae bacterium]
MEMPSVPLSLLGPFEAAGRLCSFRSAADEMNLTPSAVSHAVRKLETLTGVRLFSRNGRKVRLTAEGEALLERVQTGLESIREGIDLISTHQPQLLRLHCAPSLAAQWLTPRLASLFRAYPALDVRLAANLRYADFPAAEFDVDITYGQHAGPDCYSIPLGYETVTPMCAPHLAHRLQRPEDILSERLIHSDNKRVRWIDWFHRNSITAPETAGSRFDRSFIAIAAAVDGLGVCLESTRLAERELRDGRLVCPLINKSQSVDYLAHYFVYPESSRNKTSVRLFRDWLFRELELPEFDENNVRAR